MQCCDLCHLILPGSFATASCTRCKRKVLADEIRDDVFAQKIPKCSICHKENLPPLNLEDSLAYRGQKAFFPPYFT